jgi:hypothetical protein
MMRIVMNFLSDIHFIKQQNFQRRQDETIPLLGVQLMTMVRAYQI